MKLANSMSNLEFSDGEKELMNRAFRATGPGPTDREKMKKILGTGLYNDILMMKVENSDFENLDVSRVLGKKETLPDCEYFVLHTDNDAIVPSAQGGSCSGF